MSAKKSIRRKRPSPPNSKYAQRSKSGSSHKRWSRSTVWITGVASALVIAAATAFGSGVGNRLFSIASRMGATSPIPVEIESVSYISPQPSLIAYPGVLTKKQVLGLTSGPDAYSDGVPHDFDQYMNKVARYRGAPVGDALVQVVVRGNSTRSVVITGIGVVKNCGPPLTGTLVDPGGGGAMDNVVKGFNLDQQFPYAQFWNSATDRFYGNFFAARTVVLRPGELGYHCNQR